MRYRFGSTERRRPIGLQSRSPEMLPVTIDNFEASPQLLFARLDRAPKK